MLELEDIEDALITDLKAYITGIKTVETYEREFDEQTLVVIIPRAPFALIRYVATEPVEGERGAKGESGMKTRSFQLAIGAASLRSKKEAQRGCYEFLDAIRARYDGRTLAVSGDEITFGYGGDGLLFSVPGLTVYSIILQWNEN